MIIANKESSRGQFILETKTGYHIHDLSSGEEVSIGWESIDGCEYLEIIVPKTVVCDSSDKSTNNNCSEIEFDHELIVHDPVICPETNACLRWHKNSVDCYEYGDCTEGVRCNIVLVNNNDVGGNFSFKTEAGEFNYFIDAGSGRSIGWAASEECNYWDLTIPTKTVCGMNICGDGICSPGEENTDCSDDCGPEPSPVCGNGICEQGESCPSDCIKDNQVTGPLINGCGNGICEKGEEEICHDDCRKESGIGFEVIVLVVSVLGIITGVIIFKKFM